jgi:hypothetical protein
VIGGKKWTLWPPSSDTKCSARPSTYVLMYTDANVGRCICIKILSQVDGISSNNVDVSFVVH